MYRFMQLDQNALGPTGNGESSLRSLHSLNIFDKPAAFRKSRLGLAVLVLAVAALTLCVSPASAFNLIPMSADMTPAGAEASTTFRVVNSTDQPIAVQISMHTRKMDLDGSDILEDAEDDFLVFPPQMVLNPKESQVVRLKWIGTQTPTTEIAHRIIAEQVPVQLTRVEPGRGNINVLIRYLGSVYIVPKGVKPEVEVEQISTVKNDDGTRQLEVTCVNRGGAHTLLRDAELTVNSGGNSVTLTGEQLASLLGANVLAGAKRRFYLPWPEGLTDGPLEASLKYTPQR